MASIEVLIFMIWLAFGLHERSLVYADLTEEYNRILIFKEPASNKALSGHVIRAAKVTDEGSCRVECYLEPNCVSVNVGPYDGGNHECELNSATDETPTLSHLSNRESYTYHGIENCCHSNPCHDKYEVCQVGFTERGFRCACREPSKEKQCAKDCRGALGMESGTIRDGQISASSQYDANHAANQGRLHFKLTGALRGAWSARKNDANQWLQVYLGCEFFIITEVATQGRNGGHRQWVTKYNLQYSEDKVNFRYYREQGERKIFDGNTDKDSVVHHELNPPIKARYIRFRPVAWNNHVSMRVEVYGCSIACPAYWKPFETSLYAVFSRARSWKHAEGFCRSIMMGAHLAKIESRDESVFIESLLADLNSTGLHWIGLTDIEVETHWKWSDGSFLGSYYTWAPEKPDNSSLDRDCAGLFRVWWHDRSCLSKNRFICEKKD